MAPRPRLRALARRLGLIPEYIALDGTRRRASDASRVAVLAAMGCDAGDETAAARALAHLDDEERSRLLDPATVVRAGGRDRLRLRLPGDLRGRVAWEVELEDEQGRVSARGGRSAPRLGSLRLPVPQMLAPGYHNVRVRVGEGGRWHEGDQLIVAAPPTCFTVGEALGRRRAFGITTSLYTVPSEHNWGAGDLTDLRALARWCAGAGAAFVGLNPLHVLRNRGWDVSPYGPVSRLFRNPLYLDVTAVPELATCESARERLASSEFGSRLERLRQAGRVDYEGVMALKEPILRLLHRAFTAAHRDAATARGRAYRAFVRRMGEPLTDFATFAALDRHFAAAGGRRSWHAWPETFQHPRSPAVTHFRQAHAEEVDFHCWLQFELDRQLAGAAAAGRKAGLRIGLYHDLAVGTAGDGSDPWAFPGLFAHGASVGAPPDDYAAAGQDWGFPPVDPRRLAAGRYRYWIQLVRSAMAHAGALRIDHAMGLLRLFWIPAGRDGRDGVYVRYPASDLFGILALESRRQGVVVVGEDLGTVPAGFGALLARWGILSSRVLYFERDANGAFRPASRYSGRALVTANTHDHAPLAGYRRGRDLELRWAAGQLESDAALARALEGREREVTALEGRLRATRLLPAGGRASDATFCAAVHAFLARTPASLVGVALDDLTGETEPLNLPGVGSDRYPNWSRRLRMPLQRIRTDGGVTRSLEGLRRRATSGIPRSTARPG